MTPVSANPRETKISLAASRSAPRVAAPRSEVRTVTCRSVSLLMQATVAARSPPEGGNYDRWPRLD
ncbi:hypothetical protein Sru01_27460 [Sphaerisporangium rufum]|uniref:Uncharacterized protein n=1 Tax=Sphaerisporangium rufum TaxID=1381558 RepID=A0A919R176_9ACTN|nr:hypothetical protein Sru01_27460 [Sphaerisporangium rufum]